MSAQRQDRHPSPLTSQASRVDGSGDVSGLRSTRSVAHPRPLAGASPVPFPHRA